MVFIQQCTEKQDEGLQWVRDAGANAPEGNPLLLLRPGAPFNASDGFDVVGGEDSQGKADALAAPLVVVAEYSTLAYPSVLAGHRVLYLQPTDERPQMLPPTAHGRRSVRVVRTAEGVRQALTDARAGRWPESERTVWKTSVDGLASLAEERSAKRAVSAPHS